MLDAATQEAIALLRAEVHSEPEELQRSDQLIAQAEAGEIKLGVLKFAGHGISSLKCDIDNRRAMLDALPVADRKAVEWSILRTEEIVARAEKLVAAPIIYVLLPEPKAS